MVNIDFLIETPIDSIFSDVSNHFKKLIQEIERFLHMEKVYEVLKIKTTEFEQDNDLTNFGVRKTIQDNFLFIEISTHFKRHIRLILLREAYKVFVPREFIDNRDVNIFIDQKVEIDLGKNLGVTDWKDLRRKTLVDKDFMRLQLDRLKKWLSQEPQDTTLSPFQLFFVFLRDNTHLSEEKDLNLFKVLLDEFFMQFSDYPEDILETIRILTLIFYSKKSMNKYSEYIQFFKEFKEAGIIHTHLTQKKFNANFQWIRDFSTISPNYKLNWFALNIYSTLGVLRFHPLLKVVDIRRIISQLPFVLDPTFSKNDFGYTVSCFFLIPKPYFQDLLNLLKRLKLDGILIEQHIYILCDGEEGLNLNPQNSKLPFVNSRSPGYKKEYELSFRMDYSHGANIYPLSLLDWLLIDRILNSSIVGRGFDKLSETINIFKTDLLNEVNAQHKLINMIEQSLEKIRGDRSIRQNLINLIDNRQQEGFFYVRNMFHDYLFAYSGEFSFKANNDITIEHKMELKKQKQEIIEKLVDYQIFSDLFDALFELKLFNLKQIKGIIVDKLLMDKLLISKKQRVKKLYEKVKLYKINFQSLKERLEKLLYHDPPIIKPYLLNSLSRIIRLHKFIIRMIVKSNKKNMATIERIKWLFPRFGIIQMEEYKAEEKIIYVIFFMPNLATRERQLLISMLYNLFRNDIILCKHFLSANFDEYFTMKEFYNLENQEFFYTKDLFEQSYLSIKKLSHKKLNPILEINSKHTQKFWENDIDLERLLTQVQKYRYTFEKNANISFLWLNNLLTFNQKLQTNLTDVESIKLARKQDFFRTYVKSIKFIPAFQSFGLGQYYLYFYPTDLDQIDFKHLLHNSFQSIRYSGGVDKSNSFLIKFIWPYHDPNVSALNWLVKSKKIIREYCVFLIKKIHLIFHFTANLRDNKWNLNVGKFKNHFQNVLSNPTYQFNFPKPKEFDVGNFNNIPIFPPDSSEYKSLTKIYSRNPIDIKSYLGTKKQQVVNSIFDLLEKKLIIPYISPKNLGLYERLSIIIPDINSEFNDTLVKIFSFFNIGFIHEIEGEYFIKGFSNEIVFKNGFFIKLYLPGGKISELVDLFDKLFDYLDVEHYIILDNPVKGEHLLNSIYDESLKTYNPLKNLLWDEKKKVWKNSKLFGEKMEKLYPRLNNE